MRSRWPSSFCRATAYCCKVLTPLLRTSSEQLSVSCAKKNLLKSLPLLSKLLIGQSLPAERP